ncbi:MAG: ATP-binding protein [Paracoccaceae bacterium]
MVSLRGDIVNRIRRLPKPTSSSEALQPIFEAVSNAIHAVDDVERSGNIEINIETETESSKFRATISDDGIGLNGERFNAFLTTDTGFKISRGGKGVGRLLWLDAFQTVRVSSIFEKENALHRREFDFVLDDVDQVQNMKITKLQKGSAKTGTVVVLTGLRGNAYPAAFPVRTETIVKHFGSHFLAEFIFGNTPPITLHVDGQTFEFPSEIQNLLIEDRGESIVSSDDFGELKLRHFVFENSASANFPGNHQLHLIANGRTVTTRKLDGLLGVGKIGEGGNEVYHGCVTANFLDARVNQERTNFNFSEDVAENITKICVKAAAADALSEELLQYEETRKEAMLAFVEEYPSFGFASVDDLLDKAPKNATKPEQFAQALIPTRIRRDKDRTSRVQTIVAKLESGEALPEDFGALIREAADDVRAEEQRQLTEYVLRRRVVLDVLDQLIRRIRERGDRADDHNLEETVHNFICPMRMRGDDPTRVEEADHDLWIVDERLTFARYFASDVPFSQMLTDDDASNDRSDLLIWDRLHGLGFEDGEPLKRVILIEFKRPGLTSYKERYSPMNQVSRYLDRLKKGEIEGIDRLPVRIADDCIFYCYVVADIRGDLDIHTSTWKTTADGRGRWTEIGGKYRGTLEVIEWRDLVSDARARNSAFIELAR